MTQGLSRKISRNLIDQGYRDIKWTLRPILGKKGKPIGIYPTGAGSGGTNNVTWRTPVQSQEQSTSHFCQPHEGASVEMLHSENGIKTTTSEVPISATQAQSPWQKSAPFSVRNGANAEHVTLFVPAQVHQQAPPFDDGLDSLPVIHPPESELGVVEGATPATMPNRLAALREDVEAQLREIQRLQRHAEFEEKAAMLKAAFERPAEAVLPHVPKGRCTTCGETVPLEPMTWGRCVPCCQQEVAHE
jgi:hypothetical protein